MKVQEPFKPHPEDLQYIPEPEEKYHYQTYAELVADHEVMTAPPPLPHPVVEHHVHHQY